MIERKYGSPSTVRVTEYESSGMQRIRIDVIAVAIDITTKRAFVAVAIAPREGQVPMVGSYLS